MKKNFENKEVKKEDVGVKVAVPETGKSAAAVNNGFVKYNEVPNKVARFKTINLKPTANFLEIQNVEGSLNFPLAHVRYMSLRCKVDEIEGNIRATIDSAREKDGNVNEDSAMLTAIKFTKQKEIIAVLNKGFVLKTLGNTLMEQMYNDPSFKINKDGISKVLLALSIDREVKHYGDDLILVLNPRRVVGLLLKNMIIGGEYSNKILLGEPTIDFNTGYINYAFEVLAGANPNIDICVKYEHYVSGSFQMTHDAFASLATEKLKAFKQGKDKDADANKKENKILGIRFVQAKDVAKEPSGNEAMRSQADGAYLNCVPLVSVPRSEYTERTRKHSNALLSLLIENSEKSDVINDNQIRKDFGMILGSKVYGYKIAGEEITFLPNYKKLAMFTLIGSIKENLKVSVSDDGTRVAINISL